LKRLFVLAALVGLCLGLLGSGGSIVTLPGLVYVDRMPAHQAVGMSLFIGGATSAMRSLVNLQCGAFDLRFSSHQKHLAVAPRSRAG